MDDLHHKGNAVERAKPVRLTRLLAAEIAVGTVINIAFNLFFAWLVFYGHTPVGRDGVLIDLIPASFIPALLMTFPVTLLMRNRMGRGLTVTPVARLPVALPRTLLLRAPAIALLALALTAVPAIILLWSCWGGDWSWGTLVLFKVAFSAAHAAMVTPIVVLAAMALDAPVGAPMLFSDQMNR